VSQQVDFSSDSTPTSLRARGDCGHGLAVTDSSTVVEVPAPTLLRSAWTPSTPMIVPSASETTVRARCTPKNAVIPWCQERESFQMFFRNVGQMIQLHTPKATKNHAIRFEMTTPSVSATSSRAGWTDQPTSTPARGDPGILDRCAMSSVLR
jgi:hypothetical protein